jgi:peptidylprolyl isomerase
MLALRRTLFAIAMTAVLVAATGCGDDGGTKTATYSVDAPPAAETGAVEEAPAATKEPKIVVPKGPPPKELKVEDLKEGSGPAAKKGDAASLNYVGVSYSTGKKFDSSYDSGTPIDVPLGEGRVIQGWDQGIVGMKVGGRRKLTIPPDLGYGAAGFPPDIKPNETLVFVVDLVSLD